jgi:hypothetical protein
MLQPHLGTLRQAHATLKEYGPLPRLLAAVERGTWDDALRLCNKSITYCERRLERPENSIESLERARVDIEELPLRVRTAPLLALFDQYEQIDMTRRALEAAREIGTLLYRDHFHAVWQQTLTELRR